MFAHLQHPGRFDPASLALSGWWRADYSASPWAGVASAGASGGRDVSEATNPPAAGTSINGRTPALFDGTNDVLASSPDLVTAFLGTTAYAYVALFNPIGGLGAYAGASPANSKQVFSSSNRIGLGITTTGAHAWHYDGAFKTTTAVACATGSYHMVAVTFTGGTITIYVDNVAPVTAAAGNVSFSAIALSLGKSVVPGFTNQSLLELMMMTSLTADDRDNIKSYYNNRYALSIP